MLGHRSYRAWVALVVTCASACELPAEQPAVRPSPSLAGGVAAQAAPSSTIPNWIATACSQRGTIGDNPLGRHLEAICKSWSQYDFDTNIGLMLSAMYDPTTGIGPTGAGAPFDGLSADKIRFIIMCGRPTYPTLTGSLFPKCDDWAVKLFGKAIDPANPAIPEWNFYLQYLRRMNGLYGVGGGPLEERGRSVLATSFIHMMTADQVMRFQAAAVAGCTGTAKVFAKIARAMGLNVRYVATVSREDYIGACCTQGTSGCTGHPPSRSFRVGHQAVAVQLPDRSWRLLNTSSNQTSYKNAVPWAVNLDGRAFSVPAPEELTAMHVSFPGQSGMTDNLVVAVEDAQNFDNLGLDVPNTLDNLYASGKRTDPLCSFNP